MSSENLLPLPGILGGGDSSKLIIAPGKQTLMHSGSPPHWSHNRGGSTEYPCEGIWQPSNGQLFSQMKQRTPFLEFLQRRESNNTIPLVSSQERAFVGHSLIQRWSLHFMHNSGIAIASLDHLRIFIRDFSGL